jgi:hypothetical protein
MQLKGQRRTLDLAASLEHHADLIAALKILSSRILHELYNCLLKDLGGYNDKGACWVEQYC